MAGGAYNLKGGKPIEKHKAERSNIERAENDANLERKAAGVVKFPMCLHKPGGLTREVTNNTDLAAAVAKGWYEDVRDIPLEEPDETPTLVSQMTPKQAAKAIKAASASELAAIEADEASHSNRSAICALIAEAKDNIGGAPKKKPAK